MSEVAAVTSCDVGRLPLTYDPTPPTDVSPPLFEKWTRPQSLLIFVLFLDRVFGNFTSDQVTLAWFELTQRLRFLKVDSSVYNFSISAFDSLDFKRNAKKEKFEAILLQKNAI